MENNLNELPEEYQMVIQQARQNLIDFEIATNKDYTPNWHHEQIAKELEHIEKYGDRDYKILLVSVPPRHGKSQQCSIDFPAWFLGRNPKKQIITASYSAELAQDFGGKTREKVDAEAYGLIFPDVKLKEDEKSRGKWGISILSDGRREPTGGGYVSAGVGGPITGRGAHVFIIDDALKNREEAESDIILERNWNWFTSTAFTRLEPKGVMIIIATRWTLRDITGRILADPLFSKRVKVLNFEAVSSREEAPYRGYGEALWPERYNLQALNEIRTVIGPYDWSSLYQGSPIKTEKQEFKPEWYKFISEQELSMMSTSKVLTIDTAMSKASQADYTGFCDNEIDKEQFWNVRAWRARLGAEELVDAIFSLHEKRQYTTIGIEKTAYLDGLKPYLDAEQRKRQRFLPIVELKHNQTAKEIRIRGLIPRYASGSVRHVQGLCNDLVEEQAQFPNGIHDDVLDALAYQLQVTNAKPTLQVNKPTFTSFGRKA